MHKKRHQIKSGAFKMIQTLSMISFPLVVVGKAFLHVNIKRYFEGNLPSSTAFPTSAIGDVAIEYLKKLNFYCFR